MVLGYYNIEVSEKQLSKQAHANSRDGIHAVDLAQVLRTYGLKTILTRRMNQRMLEQLIARDIPVIVNYRMPKEEIGHYAVAVDYSKKTITLADPELGPRYTMLWSEFLPRWYGHRSPYKTQGRGIVSILAPAKKALH